MSEFENPFSAPIDDDVMDQPRRTSGLAITALVLCLLGIIPVCGALTAAVGVILGLIAIVTIGGDPTRKGRGMAIVAVLIGIILIAVQIWGGTKLWETFGVPMMKGPKVAMTAGFAGDMTAFKNEFHGPAATASDAEAQAFIDELRSRYGEFVDCRFDEQRNQNRQGKPGEPEVAFGYRLEFSNKSVDADATMIFADESTGQIVVKWGDITVFDKENGDLVYPPPGDE